MILNKKAFSFVYILILLSLSAITSLIIFNNSFILNNIIDIWKNNNSLNSNIYDKTDISFNILKKYNSNWSGFIDAISCPLNVIMSWTLFKQINITTEPLIWSWILYCSWTYNLDNFIIYFNDDYSDFKRAYYSWSFLDLQKNSSPLTWSGSSVFPIDNTFISFDALGTYWDNIDDNINNDDYKVSFSSGSSVFNYLEDDDVFARKNIFGILKWNIKDKNIFWNNYFTNVFIDNNINNEDNKNITIWKVLTWYIYIDFFYDNNLSYDLKIKTYDHYVYKNDKIFLLDKTYSSSSLSNSWYIQLDNLSWNLYLTWTKSWNEFNFNFLQKDYAIFLSNNTWDPITYRLYAQTDTWTWIYINSIDDSKDWHIEFLWTDIILDSKWDILSKIMKLIRYK